MLKELMLITAISFMLVACGSSGGGGTSVATGQFKDSNTAGVKYVSGEQSGITGTDGRFTYEVGNTVTFSIGGITLGTSSGKSIVTPVDLVPAGNSSSVEVQNIVRFLIMLDEDGDPVNGINIAASVQAVADSWSQVDFSVADLTGQISGIVSDAATADGGTHILPSISDAQAHLESTLRCSASGAYKGTFSGDDRGTFGLLIDATTGSALGVAYSTLFSEFTILTGSTPINFEQNISIVSGVSSDGAIFNGEFTSVNNIAGTWLNTFADAEGSFNGTRVGGSANALFRYTGRYVENTDNDYGLFSFDIDDQDNISGIAYSIAGDEELTLSGSITQGSVSNGVISVTASDGTVITGSLFDGQISGDWDDAAENLSGTYSGSGCRLN